MEYLITPPLDEKSFQVGPELHTRRCQFSLFLGSTVILNGMVDLSPYKITRKVLHLELTSFTRVQLEDFMALVSPAPKSVIPIDLWNMMRASFVPKLCQTNMQRILPLQPDPVRPHAMPQTESAASSQHPSTHDGTAEPPKFGKSLRAATTTESLAQSHQATATGQKKAAKRSRHDVGDADSGPHTRSRAAKSKSTAITKPSAQAVKDGGHRRTKRSGSQAVLDDRPAKRSCRGAPRTRSKNAASKATWSRMSPTLEHPTDTKRQERINKRDSNIHPALLWRGLHIPKSTEDELENWQVNDNTHVVRLWDHHEMALVDVPADGDCFFHAILYGMELDGVPLKTNTGKSPTSAQLRACLRSYMKKHVSRSSLKLATDDAGGRHVGMAGFYPGYLEADSMAKMLG